MKGAEPNSQGEACATAAVILAAGESRRMGQPKALLPVPGTEPPENFLDRMIGLFAAHSDPVIVVLGANADLIRSGVTRAAQATFVVNDRYAEGGQLSSLQCGLRAVPDGVSGVLFTPVDFPRVMPQTVAGVAAAFLRGAVCGLVIPRYRGRRGHPVCVARRFIGEFLNLPEGTQARQVIHRHEAEACYVDVDDPGILRDVDDPEAYRALSALP